MDIIESIMFSRETKYGDVVNIKHTFIDDVTIYDVTKQFVYFLRSLGFSDSLIKEVIKLNKLNG